MIDRNTYGRNLVKEAYNGGIDIMLGTKAVGVIIKNSRVAGVEAIDSSGSRIRISANIVVDASARGVLLGGGCLRNGQLTSL
jgi:flavin-dependent dehydrogenase